MKNKTMQENPEENEEMEEENEEIEEENEEMEEHQEMIEEIQRKLDLQLNIMGKRQYPRQLAEVAGM